MEAEISKNGEVTIVRLRGRLDFETPEPFKRTCLARLKNEQVVFNMQDLSFVGSSGITGFIDALSEFWATNTFRPKFCGINSEFRRLFFASNLNQIEIFEDQMKALYAFTQPVVMQTQIPQALDENWVEDSQTIEIK